MATKTFTFDWDILAASGVTATVAVTEADDTVASTGVLSIEATSAVTFDDDTVAATASLPIVGRVASGCTQGVNSHMAFNVASSTFVTEGAAVHSQGFRDQALWETFEWAAQGTYTEWSMNEGIRKLLNAQIYSGTSCLVFGFGNSLWGTSRPLTTTNRNAYAAAAAALVGSAFGGGKIGWLQIWNEWNLEGGSPASGPGGTNANYEALFTPTSAALQAAGFPKSKIVTTGLAREGTKAAYLALMLDFIDNTTCLADAGALGLHLYNYADAATAADMLDTLDTIHGYVTAKTGDPNYPIVITEWGWPRTNSSSYTETQVGQWIAEFIEGVNRRPWVKAAYYFQLRDEATDPDDVFQTFGLLTSAGVERTRAGYYRDAVDRCGFLEDDDTVSATATVGAPITATVAATEADDTVASTGVLSIPSTVSAVEADDTVASTATLSISGTVSATEADDTVSATATLSITATVSATEDDDTVAATGGAAPVTATVDATEADDTVSATATLSISGTVSATEDDDTVAATGTLPISATVAAAEADDTVASTATLSISATVAATEADDTVASTATLAITATVAAVEADDTVAATGVLPISGTVTVVEDDDTVAASGGSDHTGSIAIVEDDDTVAATGVLAIAATVTATEADDTVSGTATLAISAVVTAAEDDDTVSAAGTLSDPPIAATVTALEDDDQVASTGVLALVATVTVVEDDDTVSAFGLDPSDLVGTVTIVEADDTVYSVAFLGDWEPALGAPGIFISARPAALELAARPASLEIQPRPASIETDTDIRSLNPTAEAVT